jgi:hypothetical protein
MAAMQLQCSTPNKMELKPSLLPPANHSRRAILAFTLVETLFAMASMSMVFVSLYAGISWGFATVNLARENLRATQIAVEKMETMRMYSWEQVLSNSFVPASFTAPFFPGVGAVGTNNSGVLYYGTTSITNANVASAYTNDMRLVVVNVYWTNNKIRRSRTMETFISQYGMQRYIY